MGRLRAVLGCLILLSTVCGCSSMARLNIVVKMDEKHIESLGGMIPTVEVNLVGVNESEYPQWEGYSCDQYWSADDKLRKGADRKIFNFGETEKPKQTLLDDAAVWDTWAEKTASYLFVFADIPGVNDPKGGKDGRVIILPLDPSSWSDDTITITIKAGGITCTPSPQLK